MNEYRLWVVLILCWFLMATTAGALEGEMADEFAYLSGQARQAMDLSPAEIEDLIERCSLLLAQTDSLQKSEKKIMGKRLTRLHGLFLYVLESKQVSEAAGSEK